MIVNLYVDRMMTTPPESMYDVWDATSSRDATYREAAARIGLTPAEYQEFRSALLDGKALYIRLPKNIDAMAGVHHHQVYALKHVQLRGEQRGWQVTLADGVQVLVPAACGNLSMQRPRVLALQAHKKHAAPVAPFHAHKHAPAPAPPALIEVSLAPPVLTAPPAAFEAPVVVHHYHPPATTPFAFFGQYLAPFVAPIFAGSSDGVTPILPAEVTACPAGLGAQATPFCING